MTSVPLSRRPGGVHAFKMIIPGRPMRRSLLLAVVVIVGLDGIRVAQGPQPLHRLGGGKAVAAQAVEACA